MRVPIKGHGYRGVPEKMLDQFWMNAAPKEQGSARMSEVVPAFAGWPRMPEQGLEVAVDDIL